MVGRRHESCQPLSCSDPSGATVQSSSNPLNDHDRDRQLPPPPCLARLQGAGRPRAASAAARRDRLRLVEMRRTCSLRVGKHARQEHPTHKCPSRFMRRDELIALASPPCHDCGDPVQRLEHRWHLDEDRRLAPALLHGVLQQASCAGRACALAATIRSRTRTSSGGPALVGLSGYVFTRDRGTLTLRERSHSPSAFACASRRSVEVAPVPSSPRMRKLTAPRLGNS